MATELCVLAEKYRVDKCPKYLHTYTPHYHAILSPLRDDARLILEIGIGNIPLMRCLTAADYKPGASLFMWRDYFPKAEIIGCDILPEVQFMDRNITTFVVDQSNPESLGELLKRARRIGPLADVILDDGSHQEEHMATSFQNLWSFVRPGGFYIIEDVRLAFFDRIANLHKEFGFTDAELFKIYKGRDNWDNFVVFQKRT